MASRGEMQAHYAGYQERREEDPRRRDRVPVDHGAHDEGRHRADARPDGVGDAGHDGLHSLGQDAQVDQDQRHRRGGVPGPAEVLGALEGEDPAGLHQTCYDQQDPCSFHNLDNTGSVSIALSSRV